MDFDEILAKADGRSDVADIPHAQALCLRLEQSAACTVL